MLPVVSPLTVSGTVPASMTSRLPGPVLSRQELTKGLFEMACTKVLNRKVSPAPTSTCVSGP